MCLPWRWGVFCSTVCVCVCVLPWRVNPNANPNPTPNANPNLSPNPTPNPNPGGGEEANDAGETEADHFEQLKANKLEFQEGVALFNAKPTKGIKFLQVSAGHG